jgi:hypothetical protein
MILNEQIAGRNYFSSATDSHTDTYIDSIKAKLETAPAWRLQPQSNWRTWQ